MKRALGAALAAFPLAGCALLLGGLDEGSERTLDAATTVDAMGFDAAPHCPDGIAGFRYRRPIAIEPGDASVIDYTLPVAVPVAELVAGGKLQATANDLRFADDEGRLLPYWLDGAGDGGSARAYVRMDLRHRPSRAWLHYGNPGASSESRVLAPYLQGIVDDPTFQRRDGWDVRLLGDSADVVAPSWSVAYEDEGIHLTVERTLGTNGAGPSACQTVTFPLGSQYRIVFDVSLSRDDTGSASVVVSGLGRHTVWVHSHVVGERVYAARNEETVPFEGGTRVVCLDALIATSGRVDVQFSRIRVRREVTPAPTAIVASEERSCP